MSDTTVWDKLLTKLLARRTRGAHVKVGVLGDAGNKDHGGGVTVVDIAMIHEFGAPGANIPERSFIRDTMTKEQKRIGNIAGKVAVKVVTGTMPVVKALDILGLAAVSMVKKNMTGSIPPPLQAATIEAKGSSKPLIDTGQLLSSITHEVIT